MADRMSGGAVSMHRAAATERRAVTAREELGVMMPLDDARAAQLGLLHELPSMGEVLAAWMDRIATDRCEDYLVSFSDLLLEDDGRLAAARYNPNDGYPRAVGHITPVMPMTYRAFGNLIRHHCNPPRNCARNLIELPVAATPPGHAGRTGRHHAEGHGGFPSPRAAAYNAWLDKKKARDAAAARIAGDAETSLVVRTRLMNVVRDGDVVFGPRTVIGTVSLNHCLRDGDDDKLIAALSLAFAGSMNSARAEAFRGVDQSEMRAVFPSLEVSIPDAGPEKWMGYVTARNSESGAKSWSVSAGLYRNDGASVAVEAVIRTGRHVGTHVAERMVEVAQGAEELLRKLVEQADHLASIISPWSPDETLRRLRSALAGTVAHDGDVCCGIAFEIGRATAQFPQAITVGLLMNVLGRVAASVEHRVDARPIEVMLGRMLLEGWTELKAVAVDGSDDGSEEE